MDKIKIMRIIARLNIGGPAIHTILLAEGLDKSRYESILVCGVVDEKEADMCYFADKKGVKPLIIEELGREISLTSDITAFFKLFRLIKKEKPFIIHTHTAKAGTLGRVAAALLGVPVRVHTFHGHIFHGYFGLFKSRLFIIIEKILAIFTDKIIVVSLKQKEELVEKFKIAKPEKIEVIRLGFELEEFLNVPEIQDNSYYKEKMNLSRECITIGIVGRLTPIKNHRMFIETAAQMVKNTPLKNRMLRFIIIGDGELRRELENLTQERGISADVEFMGWQDKMNDIYAALDIVTLTSLNEGTPVSLIEAMASARAVVATDVGGVSDIVRHNETGLLVNSGDIDNLREHLICLIEHPEERVRLGLAARESVKTLYLKDRLIRDVEKLYSDLITQKMRN